MNGELKVGFLISHPIQYCASLFRELARQPGIDLTVIYCSSHGVESRVDRKFGVRFRWDTPLLEGYRHRFLPDATGRSSPHPPFRPLNPGVAGELMRERYDVLIVHGYAYLTCWLAVAAAKASGTAVLMRGESNLLRKRGALKRVAKWASMRALLSAIDGYLAIGTRSRQYAEFYGMPSDRVFVAPYCVDNRFFAEHSAGRATAGRLRQELGVAPEAIVFAFVGKIYPRKSPMDLLRAFRRAGLRDSAALLFVGDGRQRAELEAAARREGMSNVRFLGFVNQFRIPDYYALTDVLVLPSRVEPWGLVVNEAMACGCAVAVSDACGCAADLLRDGVNGRGFPAGDVDALARILRELSEDPERTRSMGHASRRIIADWTPEACAARIAEAARKVRYGVGATVI